MTALETLRERVEALDAEHTSLSPGTAPGRADRFVGVMASYTHTWPLIASPREATLDPGDADALVAGCRLLDAIAERADDVVEGPLARSRQHWIATARHADAASAPDADRFVGAAGHEETENLFCKPSGLGLFSSTALPQGASMWRVFLDLGSERSIHPRPWYTWELTPEAGELAVLEIATAAEWAAFLERHGVLRDGLLHPDWRRTARQVDAVHVTARAIAAAQGFHLQTSGTRTARMYWDVETTLWLRWRFSAVRLVEVAR